MIQGEWYRSFADAYAAIIHDALTGESTPRIGSRHEPTLERLDHSWRIPLSNSGLFSNASHPSGGTDLRYLAGELLWYFSGRNDLAFIQRYSRFWDRIANPDGSCNSAYGRLLFQDGEYAWCLAELYQDPASRRAVASLNRPQHHSHGNKDVVCTLNVGFLVRNGYLDVRVNMRSSDVYYGLPFDVPFFLLLGRQMVRHLRARGVQVAPGDLRWNAWSTHAYQRDWRTLANMDNDPDGTTSAEMPDLDLDLVDDAGAPSLHVLTMVSEIEEKIPTTTGAPHTDFTSWLRAHALSPKRAKEVPA